MARLLVLATLISGCVHADRVALATSTATLVCDWMSTHSGVGATRGPDAMAPYGYAVHEQNPLLGPDPSTSAIDAYFATSIALNAAVWALLPERARAPFGIGVAAVETYAIAGNVEWSGVCGL